MPGNSLSAFARITWSRPTNSHSDESRAPRRSHCGRSLGSFTRTSTASPLTGSSSWNAHEVERFETYGKGWAASRLSGVSTGEMSLSNTAEASSRWTSVRSSQPSR